MPLAELEIATKAVENLLAAGPPLLSPARGSAAPFPGLL